MLIVGLTGSIGMGKSTAAAHLREKGVPVFDADAEVHRLYAAEAVPLIEAAFPGTTGDGKVDRARLSARLMADPSGFKRLEAIVHPLVQAAERAFLQAAAKAGEPIAVLEIPLLFESGGAVRVDITIVVSAGPEMQRRRVLARPGMSEAKLQQILARQMSDAAKRAKADFIVDTSGEIADTQAQIDRILESLKGWPCAAFQREWA
jgi:dephospho-CoA kinase